MHNQQIVGYYVDPNFRSKSQLKDRLEKIPRFGIMVTIPDSPFYDSIKEYCSKYMLRSLVVMPPEFSPDEPEYYEAAMLKRNKKFAKACDFVYLFGYDFSVQFSSIQAELDLLGKPYEIVQNI
jgi:hypothetical protein